MERGQFKIILEKIIPKGCIFYKMPASAGGSLSGNRCFGDYVVCFWTEQQLMISVGRGDSINLENCGRNDKT
jgi:hypothetical protein